MSMQRVDVPNGLNRNYSYKSQDDEVWLDRKLENISILDKIGASGELCQSVRYFKPEENYFCRIV